MPIGLITLPIVTAKASDSSRILGCVLDFRAKDSTTGVPMIASVSFIKKAEKIPIPKRMHSIRASSVLALPNNR